MSIDPSLTVAERLALVRAAQAAGLKRNRAELPAIERADRGARLPLSFAQQRLWFLEQMGGLGSTYHIPGRMTLRGALDRDALVRALDRLVERHEALRTTFAVVNGEPEQRIAPETTRFALVEHDLAGEGGEALARLMAQEAAAPFDLEQGPLIRGCLVRLADDEHLLLLTMHHIVSDGWSMGVLVDELGRLYAAFRAGEPDPLPPLPIQYADYAAWQRRWVEDEVLERQAAYWTRTLAGAPALLELPTDHPRPQRQDHAGAYLGLELDEALTAGLKELGRRHGTTPFMTLLAAWAVVLGRLSGQEQVVIGTPTANRGRREIEGLIGFFVNTLALRVDLSPGLTVAALLEQVKRRALEAQQNQDIPFEQVVERVAPVRTLASAPVFQVIFAWQDPRGGAEGRVAGVEKSTAKFDLSLSLSEAGGRIAGGVTYATSLFEQATVERQLGYLRRVLEQMAADDARTVDGLELLPDAERRLVVEEWNAGRAEYPRGACIHALFEAQAERTPDAVAVAFDAAALSYAELNRRANRLAHRLRELGVGPDARVGLCVERSLEMVVGVLGILKAGGAWVPLEPGAPAERLRYMLRDSAPRVVLAQASTAAAAARAFAGQGVEVLDVDSAALHAQPATNPAAAGLTPAHLAYVIYTSGSTGEPKGVMVAHGGVVNLVHWMTRRWPMDAGDALLQKTPLSFDVSVWELFWPLASGARLVMARPEGHKDPDYLAEVIRRERITAVAFVPSMLDVFLANPAVEGCTSLKWVMSGGEALPDALVRRLHERLPGAELYNRYAPTEATVNVVAWRCDPGAAGASIPIGRPRENVPVYILDARGEPAPVGVTGELYIGGVQVARGYQGRPELTAARFVPDPFGEAGARLYRTGDLARWRPDGAIELVGRDDFQVKVRGIRIELGEIEARLREHPAVREGVVLARDDAPGDRRLVAYYVADEPLDVEALRRHVGERLPEYMVPAAYVRLESLPLTSNGKLDRRALPAPEREAFARRGYEAPQGEVEQALAEIWSDVLGAEQVGRWDDFFELGGHSLLVVRVVSRVRQVLGAQVDLGVVFQHPVLKELAEVVAAAGRADLPPIERADRGAPLPLSFAQQRLWFLEQMGGLGGTYHMSRRMRLQGQLDRDALVRALDRLVARHETLRTAFPAQNGEPEQRIAPESTRFHLVEQDLAGETGALQAFERLLAQEVAAPFDLEQGPLIRGRLVRLAEDDHVLLLTMHHIVSDGWSTGVLVDELGRLYAAFRAGRPDPLPPLPIQYADYAAWQRRWVQDEVLERQASYWTQRLSGAPQLLELPSDHPRAPRRDHAGAAVWVVLDETLTAGLKALGRRHGTTLFMTLLAGWATVLSRLSGQREVVVGTPTANRGRREIEGLIGFFVNTLALRVDLSERPTVAALLEQVKARTLEAQQNQDIPFEQVVELLDPVRTLSHTPLFQALFTWQNTPRGNAELPGVELGRVPGAERTTAKFDLSLSLAEGNGRIVGGGLAYATSLFERDTIERHVGYLRRVLEQMVADDAQPVDRLAILSKSERRLVVEQWNGEELEHPRGACIHELFQAQAERSPDAVAVVFGDEALSYAELNRRANRLAHHLRALGVGPDARVGLCVERSLEMVVGVLGILKAGGAWVPLDPAYPAERLRYLVEDSGAAVVLTRGALAGLFADAAVPVVDLAAADDASRPETNPDPAGLTPAHLAYVIYTSGSTGEPKGVMVAHGGVVNLVHWMARRWPMDGSHALLQKTPLSFDVSVWELFWPLVSGARLVVARPEGHRDPDYLAEVIRRERITAVAFVPSMLDVFLANPAVEGCTSLKWVMSGGEALPDALVRRLHERLPGAELYNRYAPTEATVNVLAWRCEPGASVHLGRPRANIPIYLLDAEGEPVPVGVTGELYIGGVQVARGYQGRPELTAERFVPDPFGEEPGARLYRTGDLARWRTDGEVELVGRDDFQVKVRGIRIELGEIEARLREHPAVREGVVLAREDAPGEKRLVAYYVAGEPLDVEALRRHMGERLPEYMVPAACVHLERLPLTPNGKLDRGALPAPEAGAYARRGYEAPAGETEQALAEIWSELLGVERVGRGDDFFELGGHSLLVVRLVSRVRQVLHAQVELGLVFQRPVLKELAEALDAAGRAELPPIERADRDARLPLSYAQQRLWFLEQLGELGSTYHIARRLRLRGELDREALVRALDRLVERHEALRTTFPVRQGHPEQRIGPDTSRFHLVEHDLAGQGSEELERLMAAEAAAPFELERGPLIRGRLVRLADDDHVLLLTMHHIVSDGWSMGVLVGELSTLYAAFRAGRADPLPPLPVQYADYAAWQRRWVQDEVLEAQADYWTRTLGGAPALLELPTDHPRPQRQDHAGARLAIELDEAVTAGLKALSRRHGTTLFMTLLAGWAAVLARLSGQEEVVIGTPTANRGRREIEGLIGFFVNTLALRVDLSERPTVAGLLEQVKARALEAQQNQDIPFEQVVEIVQPARSMAHTPLFQVMFAWQNASDGRLELPGLRLEGVGAAPRVTAKFDLSLTLQEAGGRIAGSVEYATSLYERATVERHAGYLRRVLEQMAADDGQPVDRLALLPEGERLRVMEEWSRTGAEAPAGRCVHALFEEQVERTPDAVALVSGDEAVTYGELNRRANRLAHHLAGRGVRPDARVGICVERGPEMIVGVLAVLKAGGAYVPLDPAYPAERLRYTLQDSGAVAVLARGAPAGVFAGLDVEVIDPGVPAPASGPETNPRAERTGVTPGHLAYVIYTSGSTGAPKGVMVTHASVHAQVAAVHEAFGLVAGDRSLQFASLAFDASVEEIFGALLSGAALVLRGDDWLEGARTFWARCETYGVTVIDLPTRFWQLVAQDASAAIPECVRLLAIGGEAVEPAALEAWFLRGGHRPRLLNTYGPTETTVNATFREVTADPAAWRSIGRPVLHAHAWLLDAWGEPVPVGVVGELCIGGVQVARGYLGRPALTAERFAPDPFAGEAGARLYRTGDLARWRPDGTIEFVGRADNQVKIRGFRIEPGEIEARLREHPAVREAVVVARADAPGDPRLVAYYVAGESLEVQALRGHVSEALPEHMVPAAYVRLDRLPLTPTGKLDRRALPAPEDEAFARCGWEAPEGETEQALAEIWSELLGVERVGRWDDFFGLGGHSLLVLQVIDQMRRRGLHAEAGALFATPVLADLAAATTTFQEVRL